MLTREKGALGFYLSGHPLERIESEIAPLRTHLVSDLSEKDDQKPVSLVVMISKIRKRQTKRGDAMAIITVDDRSGPIEVVVFPSVFQEAAQYLEVEKIVVIQGVAEISEEEEEGRSNRQIRANRLFPLENAPEKIARQIGIVFPADTNENLLFQTKVILQRNPGKLPVTLIFDEHGSDMWRISCGEKLRVSATQELIEDIRELVGENSIRIDVSPATERT